MNIVILNSEYSNKKKIEKYLNIDQSLSKLHFWVQYKGCKVGKTSTKKVFRIRSLSKSYNAEDFIELSFEHFITSKFKIIVDH